MSMLKEGASAYSCIFDPCNGVSPSFNKIVQDMYKVVHTLKEIYKAHGICFPCPVGGRTTGKQYNRLAGSSVKCHEKHDCSEYNCDLAEGQIHTYSKTSLNNTNSITRY